MCQKKAFLGLECVKMPSVLKSVIVYPQYFPQKDNNHLMT